MYGNVRGVCERCGFQYLLRDLKDEPGTGTLVCPTCNDRGYSLSEHPQNQSPDLSGPEGVIDNPSPDVQIITSVTWTPRDTIYYPSAT